jgi:integrase
VKVAIDTCPYILKKKISPHVLRHTCAMVMVQATHDIRKVSLWSGHSSIQTAEIYLQADQSEKLEAINAITPAALRRGTIRPPDKLIALLTKERFIPPK